MDECLWAIGIPHSGRTEQQYTEITHDYTLAAARVLYEQSPGCCFVFVSAAGADEIGIGPLMRPFGQATSTVEIGRALIAATLGKSVGQPERVRLDSADINELAKLAPLEAEDNMGNTNTKCIELIRVRSSQTLLTDAMPSLTQLVDQIESSTHVAETFFMQHAIYAGDLAVVLVWLRDDIEPAKGREGLLLAERMQALGPVDHAVWIPAHKDKSKTT